MLAYDKEALSAFDPPSEWRYLENDQDREGWFVLKRMLMKIMLMCLSPFLYQLILLDDLIFVSHPFTLSIYRYICIMIYIYLLESISILDICNTTVCIFQGAKSSVPEFRNYICIE